MKKFSFKYFACVLIIFALKLSSQVNLSSSLTACYALNGNGAEPINSLTGSLSAVTPTVDRFNNPSSAIRFSGSSNSKILLPNSPLIKPSNEISFSVWVKPESLNWMEILFTKNTSSSYYSAYALTFQNNGSGYKFRGYRQNGVTSNVIDAVTTVTAANTWYHVVFTISNSSMQIYVNGVLENTVACFITNYNYQAGKEVVLGGTNETVLDFPFLGSMDNIRFYNRVINATEVSALYSQDPNCVSGVAPDALFSASSITICPRDTIYLTDQSTNNPTNWTWTMPGGSPSTSTLNNPMVSYNLPGVYIISLVASNQFGSSSPANLTITVVDCNEPTGLINNNLNSHLKISPNPFSNSISVNFSGSVYCNWEIKNIIGEIVMQGKIEDSDNVLLDVSDLNKGLYFLCINNRNNRIVRKVIKE